MLLLWLAVVSGGNPWLWVVLIQPHGWWVVVTMSGEREWDESVVGRWILWVVVGQTQMCSILLISVAKLK